MKRAPGLPAARLPPSATHSTGAGTLVGDTWAALLAMRRAIKERRAPLGFVGLRLGGGYEVVLDELPNAGVGHLVRLGAPAVAGALDAGGARSGECLLLCDASAQVKVVEPGDLPADALTLLRVYLPYCVAPLLARARRRPFVVTHFAQSLDGRIACEGGDSKWIGCDDNQVHAHRMRALCDAVLVGRRTLEADRPRLTVRHVEGPHPIRVVLGTHVGHLGPLLDEQEGGVLVVGGHAARAARVGDARLEVAPLPPAHRAGGREQAIAELLFARGLETVLVEGGSVTTSGFLRAGLVDVVQVHVSPLLLGSGVAGFSWSGTRQVADGLRFARVEYFEVGDGIMVVGRGVSAGRDRLPAGRTA